MSTTAMHLRRPTIFGTVLAFFFGALLFAAPAQAAETVDLTVDKTTIVLGETVTLTWTSTELELLTASGDWSGTKANPAGSEVVEPTAVGTATYTLVTEVVDGRPGPTDTVTVEVTAPAGIIPAAVTFNECVVTVPETDGVIYSVTVDGETEVIAAGEYSGLEFLGDNPAVFTAAADEGDTLDPDATDEWTYDAVTDCLGDFGGDELVTATTACSSITFTSIADMPVTVMYGDEDEDEADGEFVLAPGATRTVKTSRADLIFVAFDEEEEFFQLDEITVPQDCGAEVPEDKANGGKWRGLHPTKAPAAGVSGTDNSPLIPALAMIGMLAFAVRRGQALGR